MGFWGEGRGDVTVRVVDSGFVSSLTLRSL